MSEMRQYACIACTAARNTHQTPIANEPKRTKARRMAGLCKSLRMLRNIGAGEGDRTLDPDLGKVVLYR